MRTTRRRVQVATKPRDTVKQDGGRALAAVRAAFAGCPGERSVMIDGAAWIVKARNPAT